jgi:hypothetical protein
MIEISLSLLLIIYGIFVLLFFIFALANLYHLFAYGFLNFESYLVTFFFLAGTVLILFITYTLAIQIDWTLSFII